MNNEELRDRIVCERCISRKDFHVVYMQGDNPGAVLITTKGVVACGLWVWNDTIIMYYHPDTEQEGINKSVQALAQLCYRLNDGTKVFYFPIYDDLSLWMSLGFQKNFDIVKGKVQEDTDKLKFSDN